MVEARLELRVVAVNRIANLERRVGRERREQEDLVSYLRKAVSHRRQLRNVHDEDHVASGHRPDVEWRGGMMAEIDRVRGGHPQRCWMGGVARHRSDPARQDANRRGANVSCEKFSRERAPDDVAVTDDQDRFRGTERHS